MSSVFPRIVHESESQRQFIRVQLPAQAELNGKTYKIKDLSAGGLSLLDIEDFPVEDKVSFRLILPFADFEIFIDLKGEVQYRDSENHIIGLRLIDLTEHQASILNHVIKSFVAGKIVSGNDLISFNYAPAAAKKPANQLRLPGKINPLKTAFWLGLTLLAILAALSLGQNIYQSLFTLKSSSAYIESQTLVVNAPANGVFSPVTGDDLQQVKTGQLLGKIGMAEIESPCDCFVYQVNQRDGAALLAGMKVFTLVPVDATPIVSVQIDNEEVQKIDINAPVTIRIAGSDLELSGSIRNFQSAYNPARPNQALSSDLTSLVEITPDLKIPADMTGRPAEVRFTKR